MKTILIADAGGTSTTWTVVKPDGQMTFKSEPFNAVQMPSSELRGIIESLRLAEATGPDPMVRFYGAGCRGEASRRVREELEHSFGPLSDVEVASDLLGAARALCGHSEGIACILGTGSNSCLYDGHRIIANTPSLGYILGDEGSGASIGRRFLGLLLKGHMPQQVNADFNTRYPGMDVDAVIEKVYRSGPPAGFLATFMPFIKEHMDVPEVNALLLDEFVRFFRLNILPYRPSAGTGIHFIGSVALHFAPLLRSAADSCGLSVGKIADSPMEGLIGYHTSEN